MLLIQIDLPLEQFRARFALDGRYRWKAARFTRLGAELKGPIMAFRMAVFAMRVLEVMFFTGLFGCAVVVILSWISVGKGSFTDKN